MADTLFRNADMIEPGDLVHYHGSIRPLHGLWIALPCPCHVCDARDQLGVPDTRFLLVDPWGEIPGPCDVRRQSITRAHGSA